MAILDRRFEIGIGRTSKLARPTTAAYSGVCSFRDDSRAWGSPLRLHPASQTPSRDPPAAHPAAHVPTASAGPHTRPQSATRVSPADPPARRGDETSLSLGQIGGWKSLSSSKGMAPALGEELVDLTSGTESSLNKRQDGRRRHCVSSTDTHLVAINRPNSVPHK
jgi:hypothetical protein